jgi:hypothetical protein
LSSGRKTDKEGFPPTGFLFQSSKKLLPTKRGFTGFLFQSSKKLLPTKRGFMDMMFIKPP